MISGNPATADRVRPQARIGIISRVFALDRELDLRSGAKRSQLDAAMKGHVIAQGELIGRYARKSSASLRLASGALRSQRDSMRSPWRAVRIKRPLC